MSTISSISFYLQPEYLLFACTGKGNFINSTVLRKIADEHIAQGIRLLVIDLSACTGMDSTFMGTLAGIGRRLLSIGGALQIAEPGERNRELLECLGLDVLLDIEPLTAPWRGQLSVLREQLIPLDKEGIALKVNEQAQHVLDAHILLSNVNDSNAQKFKGVVDGLTDELKRNVPD